MSEDREDELTDQDELGEETDSLEEALNEALNEVAPDFMENFEEARADFGNHPEQIVEIEELEFVETERVQSILESVLFASDKPVSLASIKQAFQGTSVKTEQIRKGLELLAIEYAGSKRGVTLEEVSSGYQLRTKVDNQIYLKSMIKLRPFKLSGPALETLAIIAYKQPAVKSQIDEIRGVESGHLLRALMEKGLVNFAGKSELPGKPMQYHTTRRFLEIFGLRNIRELPTLSEIDELLPEGIGAVEEKKQTLNELTGELSQQVVDSYSTGEDELLKITDQLSTIETTSQFFEDEKIRQKNKRDQERAKNIEEALAVGEEVEEKEQRWLEKYKAVSVTPAGATYHPDKSKSSVEQATVAAIKAFDEELEGFAFTQVADVKVEGDDSTDH